jgi:hypothetical protein
MFQKDKELPALAAIARFAGSGEALFFSMRNCSLAACCAPVTAPTIKARRAEGAPLGRSLQRSHQLCLGELMMLLEDGACDLGQECRRYRGLAHVATIGWVDNRLGITTPVVDPLVSRDVERERVSSGSATETALHTRLLSDRIGPRLGCDIAP